MQLCAARGIEPGFVIHDRHLFDGVDERQVAGALAAGAKKPANCKWQNIITMNSDPIPRGFPDGFNLAPHRLPVRPLEQMVAS
jgi:uncharacterized protein YydD (DUF2326 family)